MRNNLGAEGLGQGGMIFQPETGVYEKVHQIDITSLYPSIIVMYNLSPETIEHPALNSTKLFKDAIKDISMAFLGASTKT